MSQIPPYYNSVFAQTSQNNFQQQHQYNPQQMPASNFNPFNMNQQGPSVQNQAFQHYQGEYYGNQQVPNQNLNPNIMTNPYYQNPNLHSASPGMQNQNHYGSLPQSIIDQFRSCMNSAAPIFILPNACPNSSTTPQMQPNSMMGQNMGYPMNFPQIGIPYSPSPPFCYPPSCIPYALPIPVYNQFSPQDRQKEKSHNCECCQKSNMMKETFKNSNIFNETEDHKCKESKEDDAICSKKSCPSSLNLQALASQFLSIQGIIPCVATRLVLRKVAGSNVITSVDETINRALKAINQLNKDQLLTESRNAHQVNALINLHMTANPPINIIPILTMIQLKVNLLKAQVESLVNKKLMETQGVGAEGAGNLDPLVLSLKTDAELREFLAALREKECEERVNLNFAPYQAQRVIAETRLTNIQNKISQVEAEMDKRRNNSIPRTSIINRTQHQFSNPCSNFKNSTFVDPRMYSTYGISPAQTYESPDPFIIQVHSPKRLNLKPHVGSPETTYERPKEAGKDTGNASSSLSKQILENDNCPSSASSIENNLENKKKLGEKSNNSDGSIHDNDNDNQVSGPKSSSSLNVTVDNGKQVPKRNSSLKSNKVDPEVDNIPSKEFNQESGFEDKNNFEEEFHVGNQNKTNENSLTVVKEERNLIENGNQEENVGSD